MAHVVLPRSLAEWTDGARRITVDGADVRTVIAALESRFPGIAQQIEGRLAVAIDGEIVGDPMLEPVAPESEVHFLPRVGGG